MLFGEFITNIYIYMSIELNKVYCNHWLKNQYLESLMKNLKFKSYRLNQHTAFHIEDSIHYHALITDDYKKYERLIADTNQEYHSLEIFVNLI